MALRVTRPLQGVHDQAGLMDGVPGAVKKLFTMPAGAVTGLVDGKIEDGLPNGMPVGMQPLPQKSPTGQNDGLGPNQRLGCLTAHGRGDSATADVRQGEHFLLIAGAHAHPWELAFQTLPQAQAADGRQHGRDLENGHADGGLNIGEDLMGAGNPQDGGQAYGFRPLATPPPNPGARERPNA